MYSMKKRKILQLWKLLKGLAKLLNIVFKIDDIYATLPYTSFRRAHWLIF